MSGANVQRWDDVALLPWREAFEMSYCDVTVELPVVPARRRTDTRSLAAVVAEIVAERAA